MRERLYRAPTPRERERWHALWLATQGWSAAQVTEALGRDAHTVGDWLVAFRQEGPAALAFAHTGGSSEMQRMPTLTPCPAALAFAHTGGSPPP